MLALLLAAAVTQSDRLPPANPTRYTQPDVANVMAPVTALLGAVSRGDGAAVAAITRSEGGVTVAIERPDGAKRVARLSWVAFAAEMKQGSERGEERISDPAVEVDGDIAMVWAPYSVRRNGAVAQCGFNHFDLVRENGQWRILNLTWSQRTMGCEAR